MRLPHHSQLRLLLSLFFLFAVSFAANAQENLHIENEQFFITNGTTVSVLGNVDNQTGAVLSNDGELRVSGNFTNNNDYRPATGVLRFVGNTNQDVDFNNDTVAVLKLDQSGAVNVTMTGGNGMFITDSLVFVNGSLVSTNTNLPTILAGGQPAGAGPSSFVSGPLRREGLNGDTLEYPIGESSLRPVFLNNLATASSAFVTFECFDANSNGTDSSGITEISGVRYWQGSATGDYSGANNLTIGYGPDDNVSTLSGGVTVGNSDVVTGPYLSLGTSNVTGSTLTGSVTSDSLQDPDLGFFVLGSCQFLPGGAVASQDTLCTGDTVSVALQGYDASASNFQWFISTDSSNYTQITGATTDFLDLLDTLGQKSFFIAEVGGSGCVADTTLPERIVTRESVKLLVRAMLQGPYDATGDTMQYINGLNRAGLTALDNRYAFGGSATDTIMYPSYTVPDSAIDVLAVELWEDNNSDGYPDIRRDTTFGWLTHNGYIINFYNGQDNEAIEFCQAPNGNYHVVLRHRNHLGIFSENPITLDNNVPGNWLDLTDSANVYQAEVIQVNSSPPRFAMYGGNVYDQPSVGDFSEINAMDFFFVRFVQSGVPPAGFYQEDVTLDGFVNAADFVITSENNDELIFTNPPN